MKLTFEVDVEINLDELATKVVAAPSAEDVTTMLNYHLNSWNDGRKPFDVEMLEHAAARILRHAMSKAVEEKHAVKYEGQYVDYETECSTGRTAKFVLTSARPIRRIYVFFKEALKGKLE